MARVYSILIALEGFEGPILVFGASEDKQLPVKLSRHLAKALKESDFDTTYVELDGARHFNVARHPDNEGAVKRFLDNLEN